MLAFDLSSCETANVLARGRQRRRSQRLASDRRAALLGRKQVRERLIAASRRTWPALLVLIVLPPAAAILFVATTGGLLRWVVLGVSITMGPALAAIVLMITSGVGAQAMGTLGEEWTAQELRHLTRHGWHVVTGLTLRDWQIDHVVVGPWGVLVFETKWSAYPWAGTDADRFMRDRLKVAVAQANQSRFHLASKLRHVLNESDVHSVLVLWSAPGPVLEKHEPEFVDGTTVLVLGDLASFVTRFEESHTQHIDSEAVWEKVAELAFSGDALDAARGLVPGRGLLSTYVQFLVAPAVAAILAMYAFLGSFHLGWTPAAPLLETTIAVLLGIAGTRLRHLRLVSIAWTAAAVGIVVVFGLDIAVIHLAAH
jgi:hypothetical protein